MTKIQIQTKEEAVPTDTTSGGASKIANLKSFKVPKDVNIMRISPTIARQELLSYFRLINRDCFNQQFSDPFIHMDHNGDINTPMRFVPDERRCSFSISKAKLMGLTIPQMFPEMLEMCALYWMYKEGNKTPSKDSPDFEVKLAKIKETADPRFVRERKDVGLGEETDGTAKAEIRSKTQIWTDEYLSKLPLEELKLFTMKNKEMTSLQRREKGDIADKIEAVHAKQMAHTHKSEHFPSPSNGMLKRRAADILSGKGVAVKAQEVEEDEEEGGSYDDGH